MSDNYSALYELAASQVPRDSKVVELGCGYGKFADVLHTKKTLRSYVGIDWDRDAVRCARQDNQDLTFVEADITRLNYNDVSTYVTLEVLEHLHGDIELLSKLPRGSRVLLSVPSFDSSDHVRFFPSEHEALKRYNQVLDIDLWRKIKIPTGGGYFHFMRGFR